MTAFHADSTQFSSLKAGPQAKSKGERVISSMLPYGYAGGIAAAWAGDRQEQVRHFTNWNYIAIRAIAEEIAGLDPQVATIKTGQGPKQKRFKPRTKSLVNIQSHEELDLVDNAHPCLRLLRHPNPYDTAWTFFYRWSMYFELTGVGYIWCVPNKYDLPAELWVLPSHWVFPVNGEDRLVEEYEIRPYAGITTGGYMRIPADEIIQASAPNPLNILDGWSSLQAAAAWTDTAESIDASRWASFKEGVWPGMMLELSEDYNDPTDEDIERLRAKLTALYQGERKTGRTFIVPPGMKATPTTRSSGEMDFVASADQMKDWNLALHRVGKSIAGITEDVNFASMQGATANFIMRTIKPKLVMLGHLLTERLARRFDDTLCVYWDDPTPQDPTQALLENQGYLAAGVKTINEVRQEIGLEPFPHGGDDPLIPQGLSPMPYATGEDVETDQIMRQLNGQTVPQASDQPDQQAGEPAAIGGADSSLHQTVGGLNAIAGLQADYYSGKLPREAAIANVVLLFNFSQQEAQALFPEIAPQKLTPDGAGDEKPPGQPGRSAIADKAGATFDESKHPRAADGEFGSGGGSGGKPKKPEKPAAKPKAGRVPEGKPNEKAERAKASHKLVDKDIQRYAEEHNEPKFAKQMGGMSFPNGEPIDVAIADKSGKVGHAIELKTMVDNSNNKITMKRSAMERKAAWEAKNKAPIHTVVLDDQKVYNAGGVGKHDESKRVMYYRRGYGSFRVGTMHKVKDAKELKVLMNMDEAALPAAAKRPKGQSLGKLA